MTRVSRWERRPSHLICARTVHPEEAELSILGAGWRQAGFDVKKWSCPRPRRRTGRCGRRSRLYTFSTPLGEETLASHTTYRRTGPENRWIGNNRGGWIDPQFDALAARSPRRSIGPSASSRSRAWPSSSGRTPRDFPLYFNPIPVAHVAALHGPKVSPRTPPSRGTSTSGSSSSAGLNPGAPYASPRSWRVQRHIGAARSYSRRWRGRRWLARCPGSLRRCLPGGSGSGRRWRTPCSSCGRDSKIVKASLVDCRASPAVERRGRGAGKHPSPPWTA